MKVKALKSGKFAHPEPCKGQIILKEGEEIEVDEAMGNSLIDTKWGSLVKETKKPGKEKKDKK